MVNKHDDCNLCISVIKLMKYLGRNPERSMVQKIADRHERREIEIIQI